MNKITAFLCFFFSFFGILYGQSTDKEVVQYLGKNNFEIETPSSYQPFLQKISDAKFIAVGESHGTETSYEVVNTIIDVISEVSTIDYYLVEFDYSSSYYLNKYLKSGDENYLDEVFSHFEGTFFYNRSIADSFKKIKAKSELKDLIIVGIDIYHVPLIGFKHLSSIIDKDKIYNSQYPNFKTFMSLPQESVKYRNAEFIDLLKSSINELEGVIGSSSEYFGASISDALYILKAMDISYNIKISDEEKLDSLRDNQMFENFKLLGHHLGVKPSDKLFFFGGREHVIKVELPYANKFVSLMNSQIYSDGETVSMAMFYANSLFMIPNEQFGIEGEGKYSEKNFFNDNGPFFELDHINLLINAAGDSKAKGFDLNGEASPFTNADIFTKDYASTYPTGQFYDFVILINNSKATLPYKD